MYPHVNAKENVELEESDYSYKVENKKKTTWQHWLLLNRPLKVIVALILTTIVAPLLIYRFLFLASFDLPPSDGLSFGSCLIPRHIRLPCGYGDVPVDQCHSDCCYDHHNDACFHRFPSRFSYILNETWTEEVYLSPRMETVPFGSQRSFKDIRLSIDEVSSSHLSLTFYKSDELIIGRKIEEKNYSYDIGTMDGKPGELQIVVNSTQGTIFNTARGPLIASNDIWEIAFKITDEDMFGIGEIPLKENTTKVIYNHKGGLSSVPLIYARLNGSYHGLLLDTTAPTEIIIGSENQLVIRSITSFGLKFHLFVGPNPVDVMKDVSELIRSNKTLDYWMLGAHICSETATDDPLEDLQNVINAANAASMPFESHCGIKPIVFDTKCDDGRVTLVNAGATALRNARKKFVPHVSPYIRYTKLEEIKDVEENEGDEEIDPIPENSFKLESIEKDECFDDEELKQYIILDSKSDDMYYGTVAEHVVIYPKYDNVTEEFMKQLWVYDDFDGIVLENDWPLDESDKKVNEIRLYLPYFSSNFEEAFSHTPQWNATRPERYLDKHNQYGNEFAMAFEKIKPAVPIVSTSQWMNGNIIINRQGIETSWSSLQRELVEASLGGISGHWYWSSPICGDTENFDNITQTRLCAKWYMAATYFPLIKISSKEMRRDPLAFVGTDRAHMIKALNRRMRITPYLYTVLQEGPILRPMFYQFPSIKELAYLTTQFSVGDDLLIVPNLQPSQSHVHFSMPPGQWYEFWGGLKIEGETAELMTMTTTEADFLTLVRGGSIIIIHELIRLTAEETRLIQPLKVIIALDCETRNVTEENVTERAFEVNKKRAVGTNEATTTYFTTTTVTTTTDIPSITTCSAKGKLFVNRNMTVVFEADAETLKITVEGDDFDSFCDNTQAVIAKDIRRISIYGLDEDKNNVDNHRELITSINMCALKTDYVIIYDLL